jgi:hypothetical protein
MTEIVFITTTKKPLTPTGEKMQKPIFKISAVHYLLFIMTFLCMFLSYQNYTIVYTCSTRNLQLLEKLQQYETLVDYQNQQVNEVK